MVVLTLAIVSAITSAACERERRDFDPPTPMSAPPLDVDGAAYSVRAPPPASATYTDDAWAANEGSRLYRWYNCVGCHAHGGGGFGPPLMDAPWRYGSAPKDVYSSIAEGRPNGMPSFRELLTAQQIWQLVAYVRSLSGQLRLDVAPGRNDEMNVRTPPSQQDLQKPVPEARR